MFLSLLSISLSLSLFYLLLQAMMTLFKAMYIYIYIFAIFFFLSFSSLFYSVCSFFSRCYCCRRYFVWNTRHAWMRCKMHLMAEETDRSFNAYVNSCFTVFRDCLSINHISLVMVLWRERDRHKSIDFRLRRSRIETDTTGTRSEYQSIPENGFPRKTGRFPFRYF